MSNLDLALLANHPELLPALREMFECGWPEHYGARGRGNYGARGRGNAEEDLLAYSNHNKLPIGVVAIMVIWLNAGIKMTQSG
ncbi:hypothetical protein [Vreelandella venusta]|uniref:hypothetical protein n=1 Tax=Vreelandella venusta TaxID=44935 RepID=UPI00228655EE|nr:hypothetical protein [Halomonas venusta]WAM49475.1 hypothetical protein L0521_04495 [Halomonas venusta]